MPNSMCDGSVTGEGHGGLRDMHCGHRRAKELREREREIERGIEHGTLLARGWGRSDHSEPMYR